jgi:hypothetical protein
MPQPLYSALPIAFARARATAQGAGLRRLPDLTSSQLVHRPKHGPPIVALENQIRDRLDDFIAGYFWRRMPMLGHTGGSAGKPLTVSYCRGAMQRRWTLVELYRNTVRVARHDRRGQFTGRMVNPHYYSPPYTYYSRGGRTALRWTTIGESRRRAPQLEPALTLAQTLSDHLGRSADSKKTPPRPFGAEYTPGD